MSEIDKLQIDCEKTVGILTDYIKVKLSKTGLKRLVLGISGGVDSALAAYLSAKSVGAENVVGVIMPYKSSNPENEKDAEELITNLNLKRYRIKITPQVDQYYNQFPDADQTRKGNKMARERMSVLYDISALERAVVVGTSNKSEIFLGYGTLFGDLACAFNPLNDLYKTQVWDLAKYLGISQKIIEKTPSADLFAGQTDESDFGFSYRELDMLLRLLVDEGFSPAQCEDKGFDSAIIRKVVEMMRTNEFKRSPHPIARLSESAIGIDFRCPREWGK